MYKCKECGAEFEIKPDYCDCGNDEFEEILPESENENSNQQEKIIKNDLNKTEGTTGLDFQHVEQAKKPSSFKARKIEYPNNGIIEKVSNINNKKIYTIQDYISWGIFLVCVILSIVIMFWDISFSSNPQEKPIVQDSQNISSQEIPSIEVFWNSSPTQNVKKEKSENISKLVNDRPKKVVEQSVPILPKITKVPLTKVTQPVTKKETSKKVISKTQTPKSQTQKAVVKPAASKVATKKTTQKTTSQNAAPGVDLQKILKNANSSLKSTQSSSTMISTNTLPTKTVTQPSTTKATAPKTTSVKTTNNTIQKVTTQTTAPTVNRAAQRQELANYKIGLRNTIGRKIDFTRVVGDGTCTIAFKVNSAGKLVNRSFYVQSSNITLNDAVYNAVMATPSYSAPPSGYNNETMYLKITFTNGNFNITLN